MKKTKKTLLMGALAAVLAATMTGTTLLASAASCETEEKATVAQNGAYFASDFSSVEEMQTANAKTVRQMAAEGTVLLKNQNNALPLRSGANITILGKNSVNPFYLGTGSGSAANYDGLEQKKISIYQAFKDAGIHYNPAMKAFYDNASLSGSGRPSGGQGTGVPQWSERVFGWPVGETSRDKYTDSVASSFSEYNDAAVVVLTRIGGEGYDLPRSSWDYNRGNNGANKQEDFAHYVEADENGVPKAVEGRTVYDAETGAPATETTTKYMTENYLQLDDNERDLLKYAHENFGKVVVLVNSANAMDLSEIEDPQYGVDAALWCSFPGFLGFPGVVDVITGKVAPSGGLVDNYLKDQKYDPTYYNAAAGDSSVIDKAELSTLSVDVGAAASGDFMEKGTKYYSLNGKTAYILNEDYTVTDIAGGPGPVSMGTGVADYAYSAGDFSYNRFVKYKEGIFLGYKYFETVREDMNAVASGTGDAWYDTQVMYPFGYGLSYTTFSKNIKSVYTTGSGINTTINLQVVVQNTGSVAAKTPVQIYVKAPKGSVNKAAIQLAAFDKTSMLQPGEVQYLDISFDAYDIASYDQTGNGHYVLEAGNYEFAVGTEEGVAGAAQSTGKSISLAEILYVDKNGVGIDPDTLAEVKNRFEDYNVIGGKNQIEGQVLQRGDVAKHETVLADTLAERTVNGAFIQEIYDAEFVNQSIAMDDETDPWYNDSDPRTTAGVNVATKDDNPIAITVTAKDLVGLSFDNEKWDTFINEMTIQEMGQLLGGTSNSGVTRLGLNATRSGDGPQGFGYGGNLGGRYDGVGHIWFPSETLVAATWNIELAYEQGNQVGNDGIWSQITHWLAPGANIHRTAFSGRNYEYYSEDPIVTGNFLAENCKAAREKGLVVCVKHFALNDQETDRQTISDGILTFADEQTSREIYFKAFEIAVKKYADEDLGCNGLMTSFNRLGKQWIGSVYEVNVEMLRNEWGFQGRLVSDACDRHMVADIALRGGQECMLGSGGNYSVTTKDISNTQLNLLRWACKNVAFANVNSNAMNETVCYINSNGDFIPVDPIYASDIIDNVNSSTSSNLNAIKTDLEAQIAELQQQLAALDGSNSSSVTELQNKLNALQAQLNEVVVNTTPTVDTALIAVSIVAGVAIVALGVLGVVSFRKRK